MWSKNYYNVIWLTKTKEYEENYYKYTIYELYVKKDNNKYIITVEFKEGECYSWYTSAERLSLDLVKVNNFGPIQLYPKGKFRIPENDIYDFDDRQNYINIEEHDSDGYYPGAKFEIKEDMWNETPRYEKLGDPFYVFYGDNWTGKSTIARKSFNQDKILETDTFDNIYNIYDYKLKNYELIVIGWKHKDKEELMNIIFKQLEPLDKNIIKVDFSFL